MTPTLSRSHALIAVGLLLLVAPAFAPLQPVLEHDTRRSTYDNRTALEREGYRVVEYEDLSPRAQELYVETLEHGGVYTVPLDAGADDFRYPRIAEIYEIENYSARVGLEYVVVERPPNATLPPPDERVEQAEEMVAERREAEREKENADREGTTGTATDGTTTADGSARTTRSVEAVKRQVARYDVMRTRTRQPGLTSRPALLRYGAAALGVVLVGLGGYLSAKP